MCGREGWRGLRVAVLSSVEELKRSLTYGVLERAGAWDG